ncbi:MAG: hypothetical protein WCC21_16130 [Candidatus Acidiferrales bacterium]
MVHSMNRLRKLDGMGLGAVLLALAMASPAVLAQSDAPPPPPGHDVFFMRTGGGPGGPDDAIGFVGFEEDLGGKTVTGAPFSATVSTQIAQTLSDGNHINRTTTGNIARDSQGRTRRDMTLPAIGAWGTSGQSAPHVIFINDSVAGARYVLQPDKKIARKMQWRERRDRSGGPRAPRGQRQENNVTTISLGTQTINGVPAEGTRTTRTIPAGAIGNANPIVITNERWYSSELETVVMSKRSDPFQGETTFQLTNIQRQEPEASLFQVPSDYAVELGGPGGPKRFKAGRGQPSPPPDAQQPSSQD